MKAKERYLVRMKKIIKIARFEFIEKVKTRAFIIFTLVFPLIAISISIIPKIILDNSNIQIGNLEEIINLSSVYVSSMILVLLLFMLILFSGGMLIRSLVEEKSNRIIELLLSSCSPNELMTGKILGLSLLGLFQLLIWIVLAILFAQNSYIPLSIFKNLEIVILYFILGYFFFAAIFVGAGSIVNTELEAQHFTTYLSLVMALPLVLAIKIIEHPDSEIVRFLSYFPLTTSPVMILRLKSDIIPWWEILLTSGILIVSIYITILVSARIFRIGILSYGKQPSLKNLYYWFKEG